jgi:hypothetical protein
MAGSSWDLQQAIFARLKAFAPVIALVTDVYDSVAPQDAVFPYLVIGEVAAVPFNTHSSQGSDSTITIHSWSEFRGQSEIKRIQDATKDALDRFDLVVAGVDMINSEWDVSDSFVDDDNLTIHGVQRFRILIDEG